MIADQIRAGIMERVLTVWLILRASVMVGGRVERVYRKTITAKTIRVRMEAHAPNRPTNLCATVRADGAEVSVI